MIKLKIITPKGLYHECMAKSINTKSVEGEFTLLSNHIPLVAMLIPSKLAIEEETGTRVIYAIGGGLLQFANNEMRILADNIEGKEDIDLERAMEAKKRAEDRLKSHNGDLNIEKAELALKRAINRIDVYNIK